MDTYLPTYLAATRAGHATPLSVGQFGSQPAFLAAGCAAWQSVRGRGWRRRGCEVARLRGSQPGGGMAWAGAGCSGVLRRSGSPKQWMPQSAAARRDGPGGSRASGCCSGLHPVSGLASQVCPEDRSKVLAVSAGGGGRSAGYLSGGSPSKLKREPQHRSHRAHSLGQQRPRPARR